MNDTADMNDFSNVDMDAPLTSEEERGMMYVEYARELRSIYAQDTDAEDEKTVIAAVDAWDSYRNAADCIWTDIFDDDGRFAGFLITADNTGANCHPDADAAICEAYIRRDARRKGLMTKAVMKRLNEKPGRYCLLVLKNNVYANAFWHKLFETAGYEPYDLNKACVNAAILDRIDLFGFMPKA